MITQQPRGRAVGLEMGQASADPRHLAGEQFPGGVARMFGDGVEDDQADRTMAPSQVVDARPGGGATGTGVQLPQEPSGMTGGDGVEAKVSDGQ